MPTAILVDGEFFLKRARKVYPARFLSNPQETAKTLYTMVHKHVENEDLYRIFYYDCIPLLKKAHNPVTKKSIDFSKTRSCVFKLEFLEELKKLRKVAIRLGILADWGGWEIQPSKQKALLNKEITVDDLTEKDVYYDVIQKGVDIKIGLDIASLAYKKLVKKIVLISGDSDFVPAAKLARREGIDFILDPMWNHINTELHEHIDGLKSTCPNPYLKTKNK